LNEHPLETGAPAMTNVITLLANEIIIEH